MLQELRSGIYSRAASFADIKFDFGNCSVAVC